MARQRMVTRTVNVTTCEVMGLTISQAAVSTIKVQLNGTFADKDTALKAVKKLHETDDYKPTAITSMVTEEILYGMPLRYARRRVHQNSARYAAAQGLHFFRL